MLSQPDGEKNDMFEVLNEVRFVKRCCGPVRYSALLFLISLVMKRYRMDAKVDKALWATWPLIALCCNAASATGAMYSLDTSFAPAFLSGGHTFSGVGKNHFSPQQFDA